MMVLIATLLSTARGALSRISPLSAMAIAIFFVFVAMGLRIIYLDNRLKQCRGATDVAAAASATAAGTAGIEAVENYHADRDANAVPVAAASRTIRDVCLRDQDRIPVPASAGLAGSPSVKIENNRAREVTAKEKEQYVAELIEDMATCQAELDRLDAIREFHNALVKEG